MPDSGGGKTQTVTSTSGPPTWVQPQYEYAAKEAERLYKDKPTTYYPNSTVAGFSPETEQALQLTAQRATGGNQLTPAAEQLGGATLRGDYLNSSPAMGAYGRVANADAGAVNPALQQLQKVSSGAMLGANPMADAQFDRVGAAIKRQLDTAANRGGVGALDSGAYANALGSSVGDAATQFYGQRFDQERAAQDAATQALGSQSLATTNAQLGAAGGLEAAYGRERGLQNSALGLSPELAAAGYGDINALSGVGAARENQAQTAINADMDRYYSQFNMPRQDLASLIGILSGTGNTTTQTGPNPNTRSPLATGVGTGLAALGAARSFGLFG